MLGTLFLQLRWNERALKELAMTEETVAFRHRTGRLDKWKEAARAAKPEGSTIEFPEKIECLDIIGGGTGVEGVLPNN